MKIKLMMLCFLTLSAASAQSGEESAIPQSFSLAEAESYAMEHNYSIMDKQYEIEKAQQTIRETAALYYPQISTNYELRYNAILQPVAFPSELAGLFNPNRDTTAPPSENEFEYQALGGGKWQTSAGITANWFIGDISNFLAKRATEVLRDVKQLDKEVAELNVRAEVAKAYYNVLLARRNAEILKENLTALEKNRFEVGELFKNGFVEEQDLDQLELIVSNLRNNLQNVERQEVLALQFLKFQMGIPVSTPIELEDELQQFITAATAGSLQLNEEPFQAKQHVSFRQIDSQYRGSVLAYKNEKADWYPSLSFSASYNNFYVTNDFRPIDFDTYWAPAAFAAANVRWDLFTGFARPAQIQKAKIDIQRTEVAKELTENQLKLQHQQAKSDYLFALANYRNQERNVAISKKIRDNIRVKYSEGISSSLDLTQSENQFLENQTAYIQAMQSLLYAVEALEKALGKN